MIPDPLQRLRDRISFVSDSTAASIVPASTLDRPVFAGREKLAAHADFKTLFQPGLHEAYAEPADQAALIGFGLGVLRSLKEGPLLWVRQEFLDRESGVIYPSGLREYGFDPEKLILIRVGQSRELLQAGLEAARCKALAGILLELSGHAPLYDLTGSRRLMLAARSSAVPLIFLRSATSPEPSAAETRWRIRSLASSPLAANAPGNPLFEAELLRSRHGAEPKTFVLEWNPDAGEFEERDAAPSSDHTASRKTPLSGSVVSFPVHGQAESDGRRRTG